MRRKDREKDSAFAMEVIRDCEYIMLATINTDKTPYCIPISHVLVGNSVYFHCATEGQKLLNIEKDNNVCISGVRNVKRVPEGFTTKYESAVASGTCKIINNDDEKIMALRKLSEKYAMSNIDNADSYIAEALNRTCVCKIELDNITGKANI